MASTLKIPSPLRRFTNGQASLDVNGENVQEVLNELFTQYPDIQTHLMEKEGTLRNFVNIFINGENIRQKGGLSLLVDDGSDIRIIPSIAGGSYEFTQEELVRYSRHLSLPEVGLDGQKKIKNSKILVVGVGGLGSPVSLYLAAAGVGTIGLVDFDTVDISNLQRQVLFGVDQKNKSKLASATERLKNLTKPYKQKNNLFIKKKYIFQKFNIRLFCKKKIVNINFSNEYSIPKKRVKIKGSKATLIYDGYKKNMLLKKSKGKSFNKIFYDPVNSFENLLKLFYFSIKKKYSKNDIYFAYKVMQILLKIENEMQNKLKSTK